MGTEDDGLFRVLISSVREYAIYMLDPDGKIVTWNVGAERIKGYRADEVIGRHFSLFYSAEDVHARVCERELEIAEREGRYTDEGWRVRKDGSRFWASIVINAIRGDDGALIGFSKITRDMTDRKRAAEEQAAHLAVEDRPRRRPRANPVSMAEASGERHPRHGDWRLTEGFQSVVDASEQLGERRRVVLQRGRAGMEMIGLVAACETFHERHAFALDRVGDEHVRLVGHGVETREGVADGMQIVAVHPCDVPSEGAELVFNRSQVAHG